MTADDDRPFDWTDAGQSGACVGGASICSICDAPKKGEHSTTDVFLGSMGAPRNPHSLGYSCRFLFGPHHNEYSTY